MCINHLPIHCNYSNFIFISFSCAIYVDHNGTSYFYPTYSLILLIGSQIQLPRNIILILRTVQLLCIMLSKSCHPITTIKALIQLVDLQSGGTAVYFVKPSSVLMT